MDKHTDTYTTTTVTGGFLFPHLAEEDTREPVFTVTLPAVWSNMLHTYFSKAAAGTTTTNTTHQEQEEPPPIEIGFLFLSLSYWIELLVLLVATLSVAAGVGFFLYKTIIQPKQERTLQAYLIGWGLIVPFWISWPVWLLSVVDVRNAIFRFLVGGIAPIICCFRTTEAIYGFCPKHATRSARDFCFYFATVPIVARVKDDDKQNGNNNNNNNNNNANVNKSSSSTSIAGRTIGDPIPCSNSKKMKHLGTFLGLLFFTGALQSILTPHLHLNVFGMGIEGVADQDVEWHATQRYFTWQLYANSALQALLFQMYLTMYLEALTFAFSVLTGFEAEPAMDNPLLESTSPTDFWGRRWNTVVHTVLKNGVYKPLRKCAVLPRAAAVLATFVASGVFHEWILVLVFVTPTTDDHWRWLVFETGRKDVHYDPSYGGSIVFFSWQALLIGLELSFGRTRFVRRIAKILPKQVKTAIVVGMGVPLAHFFLEPYVTSGFFFQHGAPALPMVVRVVR